MFTKVIEVSNDKTISKYDSFGCVNLYPDGTTRKVETLTICGWETKTQTCEIYFFVDSGLVVYANKWVNQKANG